MWPKSNCKGCTKRELGCHSTCEDYISFRKQVDEIKAKRDEFFATTYFEGRSGKPSYHSCGHIPTKNLIDKRTD